MTEVLSASGVSRHTISSITSRRISPKIGVCQSFIPRCAFHALLRAESKRNFLT